jgi:hypothetical protein
MRKIWTCIEAKLKRSVKGNLLLHTYVALYLKNSTSTKTEFLSVFYETYSTVCLDTCFSLFSVCMWVNLVYNFDRWKEISKYIFRFIFILNYFQKMTKGFK